MRIGVIEADTGVRDWIVQVLTTSGLDAVGLSSAAELNTRFAALQPCCLVVDMLLPDTTGLDLLATLRRQGVATPIVFVSAYADVPTAVRAMKAGAVDFLEKPLHAQEVLAAVQAGLARCSERRTDQSASAEIQGLMARLTAREREVLGLILAGLSNKEMARRLNLSPKTIEAHRARLYDKMRADSLAELVRKGLAGGLSLGEEP